MNRPCNFRNRRGNPKMTSSADVTSVAIGCIVGWLFKDSKVLSIIVTTFTGVL